MKNAIIFDLDGTLWDSTGCIVDIWQRVFDRHEEIKITMTEKIAQNIMGKTMEEIGKMLFPEINVNKCNAIMDEIGIEEVVYLREHGAKIYEGMKETIEKLGSNYDLYIVSNCQDGYVPAFLEAHNMSKYFKDIEMSGRTGMEKGPNIVLLMERNHIEKAIYVGDTKGDEKAARYANIPFIHAAYGFGEAVDPDAIIHSIEELADCVPSFLQ